MSGQKVKSYKAITKLVKKGICAPPVVKLLRVQPKIACPLDPSAGLGLNCTGMTWGVGGLGIVLSIFHP